MLTIQGSRQTFCDGISRRNFLRIGGLALGGLSLPQILQAESASGRAARDKGVIMIYLPGGPPHQDMFDLKMDAPSEIRGEFRPIKTNVAGIEICEHFPRIATMMDKLAVIRSMVGCEGSHDAFQCQTGRPKKNQAAGGWPSMGSVLSKLRGPANSAIPPFVGLRRRWATWSGPIPVSPDTWA